MLSTLQLRTWPTYMQQETKLNSFTCEASAVFAASHEGTRSETR